MFGIVFVMFHRAEEGQPRDVRGPHIHAAEHQPAHQPIARPERLHIADALEVFGNRARPQLAFIGFEFIAGAARLDRLIGRFCRRFAREHRVVVALDPGHVHQAHTAAKDGTTGEAGLGHRLPAAFRDRARAIGDPFAAFQELRHHRVMFEALELHIGVEIGVFVVQMDHKPDINLIVLKMIDEGAAAGILAKGPAHRVGHRAFAMLVRVDLPNLFHAQAKFLRPPTL